MQKTYYKFFFYLTIFLILFGFYCALKIGLSIDAAWHHTNGALRYIYMTSLIKSFVTDFPTWEGYVWENTKYYPALYDTIVFTLSKFSDNFINAQYTAEIRHSINYIFVSFGILGLFFVNRKIFNKEIAILSCLLTLLNPIFFGSMGMNPKDPVVFTSLIWSIYFFINYLENIEGSRFKSLIFMSIAMGFGSGLRLAFLALLFPLFLIWLFIIFKKKINISKIILDSFCVLIIVVSLTFLTWPQIHNGEWDLLVEVIKKSSTWLIGFKHGIINGEFYEIGNTPRSYILKIFLYRIPIYISLLIILSFIIIFTKRNFFIEKTNSSFSIFFYLLLLILFFPITTMIITKTHLYDNARLFIFTMPFFATVASFSLFYILNKYKEFPISFKFASIVILLLAILSIYRFIFLTPYQYTYTNYLSAPKYSMGENKFEHDYFYTSYPELMEKIKKKFGNEEASNLKIRVCDAHFYGNKYNFRRFLKSEQTKPEEAEYVIMTNRNLRYRKMNCFQLYQGKDIVSVKRLGLTLSTLRKIESKEGKEYLTHEWRLKNESWYEEWVKKALKGEDPDGYIPLK